MKNTICDLYLMPVVLNLFDGNTDTTLDPGLSDEMKTYYSMRLINLAEPELIHDQFGQKHPIPKNSGKTIEFRKYDSLPKALVPLTEGVTPAGQKLSMGVIRATIKQYGGYIELSDILELTAIDNNLVQATRLLASQAGRTSDTITREVLAGGTNVVYAGGAKDRSELVGGDATEANNKYLSVDDIRKAVRALKVMNAQKINGYFAGIIHPDTAYDLMSEYDSLPHSYGENVLYQAEAHLIDRISLHPGVTVTDLANMVRKTPSACSQHVRRLRDKGWVEQVRNAANNRQVMLRLTPAGEHVYRDHAAFDKQCQALTFRRLEGFTEAELAAYLSIQRRINEAYADDVRRSREYFT